MVEQKVEVNDQWLSIKVRPALFNKIKKVADEKGFSMGEAIQSLEKVILKNFPHSTAPELIKCDACRVSVIKEIQNQGYWPKPEIKEVIKIIEVPAGKIVEEPTKHLPHEIKYRHLT